MSSHPPHSRRSWRGRKTDAACTYDVIPALRKTGRPLFLRWWPEQFRIARHPGTMFNDRGNNPHDRCIRHYRFPLARCCPGGTSHGGRAAGDHRSIAAASPIAEIRQPARSPGKDGTQAACRRQGCRSCLSRPPSADARTCFGGIAVAVRSGFAFPLRRCRLYPLRRRHAPFRANGRRAVAAIPRRTRRRSHRHRQGRWKSPPPSHRRRRRRNPPPLRRGPDM